MLVSEKQAADHGRAPRALVLVCLLLTSLIIPSPAWALTTNKATARPNENGGHNVIGGLPTRLTWEGTVDTGEQVVSVTLALPGDGSFADASVKVTVLDGLDRVAIDVASASAEGDSITVVFSDPIPSGSLLRLELEDTRLPSEGGSVSVTGTYTTSAGETIALAASRPIAVIANTWLQQAVAALDASPAVQAWNSNQFLGMFFKPQLMLTSLFSLFPGWLVCLVIVLAAYPFAIALGLLFALMKISHTPLLRVIAVLYINILRGTPLFLQIYIMFFGLPMLGIVIDNNVLGVAVMAINSSAYLAEIFRAGIQSIPQGQYEAAASLGMNRIQTMFTIILPQTIRRVIPTVTSDFITSYKDTSLLSSVGVMELMMFAKNATSVSGNITPYVTAALFYLVVTLPLIKVVGIIEKRLARSERGQGTRPGAKAKVPQARAGGGASLEIAGSSHVEELDREGPPTGSLRAPLIPAASAQGGDAHAR